MLTLAVLLPVLGAHATAAPPSDVRAESPGAGRGAGPGNVSHHADAFALPLRVAQAPAAGATQAAGSGPAPFLTRPYLGWHSVNSYFDHCNPDYTVDGVLCTVDGTVALRSNGYDPNFPKGYAVTKGGADYLYYDGHNGFDLGLSYEELLAAAPGTVTVAGIDPVSYNSCFGNTVVIDHGNGFSTRYAHMSRVDVSVGQVVDRGQHLGVSGTSGCSTGPHLHFGLYLTSNWTALDPWGWLGTAGTDPWPFDQGDLWITGNPRDPIPDPPTAVSATALDAAAQVSWSPPAFDGGSGVSTYTVTATPGGATVTVPGTATTVRLKGLNNFTAYTFTATASDAVGSSPASAPSAAVTPVPAWPGELTLVAPTRLLDTRSAGAAVTRLQPGQAVQLAVTGQAGIPATGASAALLNLTAIAPDAAGYLVAYPTGSPQPATSNLNLRLETTVANLAVTPVGEGGKVTVANVSTGSVDLLVDAEGWFNSATLPLTPAGRVTAVAPARIADSRVPRGLQPLSGGGSEALQVTGQGGIPAAGVAGVVANLTVTNTVGPGYLVAYSGAALPGTSNVNYGAGQTVANRVFLPVDSAGRVNVYNGGPSRVDVIVDVSAWISDATAPGPAGGLFTSVAPLRLLDTRTTVPLAPGASVRIAVGGQGGAPASARTALLNLTVTQPAASGYLTAFPTAAQPPLASDLNFTPGQTVANLVVVGIGSDGAVEISNGALGQAQVIVDLLGYSD